MPTVNVPYKNKNFNICNSDVVAMPPQNNMMVVFPSTLPHSVDPSKSNTERFCIAFNLFAFGVLDKGEGLNWGYTTLQKHKYVYASEP